MLKAIDEGIKFVVFLLLLLDLMTQARIYYWEAIRLLPQLCSMKMLIRLIFMFDNDIKIANILTFYFYFNEYIYIYIFCIATRLLVKSHLFCVDQLLLDLMAFREQALRLILDLSSTVITLLVSSKLILLDKHARMYIYIYCFCCCYKDIGLGFDILLETRCQSTILEIKKMLLVLSYKYLCCTHVYMCQCM